MILSEEYYKQLIGKKYNYLTIIEKVESNKKKTKVKALCECGKIKEYFLHSIKNGNTKSCGCLSINRVKKIITDHIENYINKKINRLTIIEYVGVDKNKKSIIKAKCECGVIKNYSLSKIINQTTKSCGCYIREITTTHGLSSHPLYHVWSGMTDRCKNKNAQEYENYGGRGVKVSMRWENDFEAFYNWAIKRWKPGLQLDKDIKSSTGRGILYCPELCCFVTSKDNSRNRNVTFKITYNNETKSLGEWSEILNINFNTLNARLRNGWSPEKAFNTPIKKLNKKCK